MPLAWACWLRKTILQLLSSFGSLDGTLRSLDLDFALLPLNGSHVNLDFPSTVSNAMSRPHATARAITNITLGPGTKIMATEAKMNCARFCWFITLPA